MKTLFRLALTRVRYSVLTCIGALRQTNGRMLKLVPSTDETFNVQLIVNVCTSIRSEGESFLFFGRDKLARFLRPSGDCIASEVG